MQGVRRRTWRCAAGWRAFLGSALPCVGASALEWVAYEGLILLAGWLPAPAAAVAVMCARGLAAHPAAGAPGAEAWGRASGCLEQGGTGDGSNCFVEALLGGHL